VILSTATHELDLAELDELRTAHQQIRQQIARQIVGQDSHRSAPDRCLARGIAFSRCPASPRR
jgi:hypothetical protein